MKKMGEGKSLPRDWGLGFGMEVLHALRHKASADLAVEIGFLAFSAARIRTWTGDQEAVGRRIGVSRLDALADASLLVCVGD